MIAQIAKKTDKSDIKKLWADAFSEQEPFLSWYFNSFWKAENSICIKDNDGAVIAALTLIPYQLSVNGKILNSSYIAGVSVSESMRMRGLAKNLMKEVLLLQIKRNEPISLLIPFNYDFYRKMEYEVCYERSILSHCFSKNSLTNCNIKALSMSDFEQMNEVYNTFCADKNGYVLRDKLSWEYILNRLPEQKTKAVGYMQKNRLLGYSVFIEEKNKTVVHEAIGTTVALENLSSYARKTNEQVFSYCVSNKDGKYSGKTVPTVMARITDMCLAMKYLPETDIKIKITDCFLEQNNGIFMPGLGKASKTENFDIEINIKYFSQWFMGFKSFNELYADKKVQGCQKCMAELDKIVKKQTNYINLIMSEDF